MPASTVTETLPHRVGLSTTPPPAPRTDPGAAPISPRKATVPDAAVPAAPPAHRKPKLLVTLATYNERDNVEKLIEEIYKFVPDAHVLVVDDNSPDGTGKLVEEMRAKDSRIHAIHRPGKLGLGTATIDAMNYAIDHGYDLMQNMDADFSHPPRFLPAILKGMETKDIMIGSRYAKGGGTENWPLARLVISRTLNTLVRFLFRMPVQDASGAFRCYRVSMLKNAHLERTQSRGYSFQQEVLFRCHIAGAKLGESPIIFENRRAGKSKVNMKEAVRSIVMILWIGTHHFFGLDDYRKN